MNPSHIEAAHIQHILNISSVMLRREARRLASHVGAAKLQSQHAQDVHSLIRRVHQSLGARQLTPTSTMSAQIADITMALDLLSKAVALASQHGPLAALLRVKMPDFLFPSAKEENVEGFPIPTQR